MAWRVYSIEKTITKDRGKTTYNQLIIWAETEDDISDLPTTESKPDMYDCPSGIPMLGSVCVVNGDGTGLSTYGFNPTDSTWSKLNAE